MRLILAVTVFAMPAVFAADVLTMEEIVAKVNGDIITSADLAQDRRDIEAELRKGGIIGPELAQRVDQAMSMQLMNRIDMLLMVQRAKSLDVKVTQQVDRKIADMMRRAEVADPDQFQALVVRETQRPYEDWKQKLTDDEMVQAIVQDEIMRKISVTSQEVRAYYDEHKEELRQKEMLILREILVSTAGKTDPTELAALEKKAQDLVARARRGEPFAALAENNSDAQTKLDGGILPEFEKGQLAENMEALVWNQPVGYVTDPIRVGNGWEILRVEDHTPEGIPPFEAVEGRIQNFLYGQRRDPALRAFLTKMRGEAFLQIKAGYTDAGAAPGADTQWREPGQLRAETITKEEVIANPSMKRLLGMFPIPGTEKSGVSSSR